MLTYRNDPLLIEEANDPAMYSTVRDMKNKDFIFFREDILNLYSALVKKKDFKRKAKCFSFLLLRMPYVSGDKVIEIFLRKLNQVYSKEKNYIKFREEIANYCNLKHRITLQQLNGWIKQKKLPFVAVRMIASKFKDESKIMADLFSKAEKISGSSSSGFLPPSRLKDCFNDLNMYFVGAAFGDGGFSGEVMWTLVDGALKSRELFHSVKFIELIKKILKDEYNINKFTILKSKNKVVLVVSNKFFCRYLNFFFDLPFSYKGEKLQVPRLFRFNRKENEYLFWRGLSDTDGSFRESTTTFTIGMKQKRLLNEFGGFLRKKGIAYSQRGQHLNVLTNSLAKYAHYVGSSHSRKKEILLNQLKKGPSHRVFMGLNKENIKGNCFELTKIPKIRVYISKISKNVFNDKSVTEIMKVTGASRQTVHNWKNNVTAMPLAILSRVYQGNFLQLLSKGRFFFTMGKTGSNKAYLPIKITDKISKFASCVRPTMRGLCLSVRSNQEALSYKGQIESYFGISFKYISSREYRCESSIVNLFFKTFFVYDLPWKAYGKEEIKELRKKWIIKRVERER